MSDDNITPRSTPPSPLVDLDVSKVPLSTSILTDSSTAPTTLDKDLLDTQQTTDADSMQFLGDKVSIITKEEEAVVTLRDKDIVDKNHADKCQRDDNDTVPISEGDQQIATSNQYTQSTVPQQQVSTTRKGNCNGNELVSPITNTNSLNGKIDNSTTNYEDAGSPCRNDSDKQNDDESDLIQNQDDNKDSNNFDQKQQQQQQQGKDEEEEQQQPQQEEEQEQENNNDDTAFIDEDGFNDFDDFAEPGDMDGDDDFGDFDDFPDIVNDNSDDNHMLPLPSQHEISTEPSLAEQYANLLRAEANIASFVTESLSKLWSPLEDPKKDLTASLSATLDNIPASTISTAWQQDAVSRGELLCTQCSMDLWQKLSRDSVFYNPITGSIGQFQWTRSEINRAYLNALGVRINYDDRLQDARPASMTPSPSLQHYQHPSRPLSRAHHSPYTASSSRSSVVSPASSPSMMTRSTMANESSSHMRSSSLTDNISMASATAMAAFHQNGGVPVKPPVEEEPELDIDIAKAYCELTEETIRVFPDVKLNAMVVELTRLQRQAKEYLGYLLDQREQLMMDAETYNDLISCIVGHAQRLREQHVVKDASPAMVNKKKKSSGLSGMIKRKNTTGAVGGTSMGGGVVGIKQSSTSSASTSPSKVIHTGEGRRSM